MELFHPKVINKLLKQPIEIPSGHLKILENWANSIKDGSIYLQKETSLHGIFTENIVTQVLGYKPFGSTSGNYDVAVEYPIAGTRVDLALGSFIDPNLPEKNSCLAPFELKGAKTSLDAIMSGRNKTPVQQAWDYAMDAKGAKWVIISNYLEIRLYAVGYGRQNYERFSLDLLSEPEEYKRFYLLLNKDNLLGGQTYEWLKQSEKQDKEITDRLYQDYKVIRHNLIHAITDNNPTIIFQDAVGYAQLILDRILFIAFAEDKGLLPEDSLNEAYRHKDKYNPKPIWENFKALFTFIDKGNKSLNIPKYNGGLFAPNKIIDSLKLPDSIFQGFNKIGAYDFQSEVSVTILGHIFEQSISDIEALKEFGDLSLKKKDGKKKKEGVVYTPNSITRFIVEKTLGEYIEKRRNLLMVEFITKGSRQYFTAGVTVGQPLVKWKSKAAELKFWRAYQDTLKNIRVVDPACGSGAFLVAAFDYLHAEYERVNQRIADLRGGTRDVFDLNKEILNNNLYGVDVNAESIEITKLSLWLKTAQRGKVLNSLDDNLRVGDSVIEDSNYSYQAFSWKEAFSDVFADGGFDVVLGNPPYVRQELISPMKPYLEKRYEVYNGVADLYSYFFELGLRILKPNIGRLGYISSATFFKTGSGENLRKYLSKKSKIDTIIDFGDVQLFEGVTTYPAIFVIDNAIPMKDHKIEFLKITEKPEDDISKLFNERSKTMPQEWFNENQWNLQSELTKELIYKIQKKSQKLETIYPLVYRGVVTGCNDVFLISSQVKKNLVEKDHNSNDIIHPFLEGKDLKKWVSEPRKLYLIFTKRNIDIEKYPAIKEYLEKHKERLMPKPKDWPTDKKWIGRKSGTYKWYEIQDTVAYHTEFEKPKIIWGNLQSKPQFSYDNKKYYINAPSPILSGASHYVCGLLNSNVLWFVLKDMAIIRQGGYLEAKPVYINKLPIPNATNKQKNNIENLAENAQIAAEKRYELQEQVRNRIHDFAPDDTEYKLNNSLKSWWELSFKEFQKQIKKVFKKELSLKQRDEWEEYLTEKRKAISELSNNIISIESDLNNAVYKVFDLTPDEIKLIEENI